MYDDKDSYEEENEKQTDESRFAYSIKKKLEKAEEQRRELYPEWLACDEMYQVISRHNRGRGVTAVDASQAAEDFFRAASEVGEFGEESDPVSLKAIHACMFLHSKLIVSEPSVTTNPLTSDASDKKASDFAGRFVRHFREHTNLDEVLESGTYLNTAVHGTGVCYVGWDPYRGRIEETTGEAQGDFVVEAVSPHDFIIDTSAKRTHEAVWCIRIRYVTIEEALFTFPDNKVEILNFRRKQDQERSDGDYRDHDKFGNDLDSNSIAIFEYWEKATPWNPEGVLCYFIDQTNPKLLGKGKMEHPYEHKELPFWIFTDIDVPDSPYGMSRLVVSSANFDSLSTIYSVVMANAVLHGQIHLLYPSGEVPKEVLEDNTYRAIPYSPHSGNKVEHLKPSAVSSDFWAMKNELKQEISDVYGMGEFSQGQVNRELSSYTVQIAIEMDDKFRIRLFQKKKRGVEQIYRQAISLCKQWVSDNRAMAIGGLEGSDEYQAFSGSNLEGNYTLKVGYGKYMPADPAAAKQQVLEILKMGLLQEAGLDPKKIIEVLVDSDMMAIKDLAEGARKVQSAENTKMSSGINVAVEEYHEHKEHLFSLNEFINSQEFESLDVEVKQKFIEHRKAHIQKQAELVAKSSGGGEQPKGKGMPAPTPKPM